MMHCKQHRGDHFRCPMVYLAHPATPGDVDADGREMGEWGEWVCLKGLGADQIATALGPWQIEDCVGPEDEIRAAGRDPQHLADVVRDWASREAVDQAADGGQWERMAVFGEEPDE